MRTIEVSEADFRRLQALAEPFVDTPATVVTRILNAYENTPTKETKLVSDIFGINSISFSADALPPLVHSKLMEASINGSVIDKINWDGLVQASLEKAFDLTQDVRALQRITGANLRDGLKEDEGYKYIKQYGFSYQGVSADDAARIAIRSAKGLAYELRFEFEWRQKDSAHLPGERGVVTVQAPTAVTKKNKVRII
jgi:hypothetical protein